MDEADVSREIVEQAHNAAAGSGARKVAGLHLVMTRAAGFSRESIEKHFEMLTREDDLLRDAALHFESKPVAATCLDCSDEFSTDAPQPICPQCGSQLVRLDPESHHVRLVEVDIADVSEEA
jgi:Zn finger protein HypA/HybF involved in hydrogenase expression